ncbi:MAG: Pup deamidase [Actinomycetota bacterium]|jgi:proteasome accessory factor A
MAIEKICGIETEYGILVSGLDISPMMASSLLVNAYSDEGLALRAWDFTHERPDMDARSGWRPEADYPEVDVLMANSILVNGARLYVDHAHPEISTPECRTIRDVVTFDRASEEIMRLSLERANKRLPEGAQMRLYKNNSDGKGNSYGCHENYLVNRETPFGRLTAQITTHFVTRQVFTGAGKVGVENPREGEIRVDFQISQRADFFEEPVGLETTVRRPIVNTRDEPHCDPSRWRRLHVIVGDANMSETATYLKLGSTAIVLCMIEDGAFPESLVIADPVTEIRKVSHDTSMTHRVTLVNGEQFSAIQIQKEILKAARIWWSQQSNDPLSGDTADVLELWHDILHGLESDPDNLSHSIDWIAKKRIVEAMARRDNLSFDHPRIKAIDFQYHDLDSRRSLFNKLNMNTLCPAGDVTHAIHHPPEDTRAYFRGSCIKKWPSSISSANWDSVVFDIGEPVLQRIPMMDPLKGTRAHVEQLFEKCHTPAELLDALGGQVEQVIDDPGW